MREIIGIDGCPSGWILAYFRESHIIFEVIKSLEELNKKKNELYIGIDIPVNLQIKHQRVADKEARKLLKNRASTIFSAPSIRALKAPTYREACEINFKFTGKKISKQSWNLFSKIKDVQLAKERKPSLHFFFEVHPELSFMALNKMCLVDISKKKELGKKIRLDLINSIYPFFNFNDVRKKFKLKDVADDDILDVIAILWSTKRIVDNIAQAVPENSKDNNLKIFF